MNFASYTKVLLTYQPQVFTRSLRTSVVPNIPKAKRVLQKNINRTSFSPPGFTFNPSKTLLDFNEKLSLLLERRKVDEATVLFEDMRFKHNTEPDSMSYELMVKAYRIAHNIQEMESLLQEMYKKVRYSPCQSTYL